MKKLLLVLSFSLLAFSLPINAATTDFGMINSDKKIGNDELLSGFSDTYTFEVPNPATASIVIANSFIGQAGKITNFAATLNGVALTLVETTSTMQQTLEGMFSNLATGVTHKLIVTGGGGIPNDTAAYGGSIKIAIAQTPIPAALWLFGSALLGLTGLKRRQVNPTR